MSRSPKSGSLFYFLVRYRFVSFFDGSFSPVSRGRKHELWARTRPILAPAEARLQHQRSCDSRIRHSTTACWAQAGPFARLTWCKIHTPPLWSVEAFHQTNTRTCVELLREALRQPDITQKTRDADSFERGTPHRSGKLLYHEMLPGVTPHQAP